jgi:hypothetical protein
MMSHLSCPTVLKFAFIDNKLIPVIVTLNSYSHVCTLSCCQGEWGVDGKVYGPHIMYMCVCPEQQKKIEKLLCEFGTFTSNYHGLPGLFNFEFNSEEAVDKLVSKMEEDWYRR